MQVGATRYFVLLVVGGNKSISLSRALSPLQAGSIASMCQVTETLLGNSLRLEFPVSLLDGAEYHLGKRVSTNHNPGMDQLQPIRGQEPEVRPCHYFSRSDGAPALYISLPDHIILVIILFMMKMASDFKCQPPLLRREEKPMMMIKFRVCHSSQNT